MLKVRVKHFLLACVLCLVIIIFLGLYDASVRPPGEEKGWSEKDDQDDATISEDNSIITLQQTYQNNYVDPAKDTGKEERGDFAPETVKEKKIQMNERETELVESETRLDDISASKQIETSSSKTGVPHGPSAAQKPHDEETEAPTRAQDGQRGQGERHQEGQLATSKDPPLPAAPTVNKQNLDLLLEVSPLVKLPEDEHWPLVLQPSGAEFFNSINFSRYQPEDREYLRGRIDLYKERAQVVGELCRSKPDLMVPANIGTLTWDVRHDPNLVWCEISKVASTSWMVNFLRLGHYREKDTSLSHLSEEERNAIRFQTHPENDTLHFRVFRLFPAPNTTRERAQVFTNALRFVIVRHPFTRLLSAYLDKMRTLTPRPPMFNFRQLQLDIIQRYRPEGSPDTSPFPSFGEFVDYVIDSTASFKTLQEWRKVVCWTPYWARCGVCAHDFQLIMKIETLDEDERFLVTLAGLEELKKVKEWRHSAGNASNSTKHYFRQLSSRQMQQLYQRYQLDFQMFGYSIHQYLPLARDAPVR
ncbi:carbohydrate sulfotransferase 11-like [Penaeus japonicus]|uniref:carbohydrate sulfotransferase 11-like n=1 Tax=Penaeus japonicus TaxID=27405 RepID=UPI001C714F91|nr:carbohydrate sulfotransferase 11-like [Penaeus japonicus]